MRRRVPLYPREVAYEDLRSHHGGGKQRTVYLVRMVNELDECMRMVLSG